ncbi:MAG: ribose-phosphate diphosphokinase [Rhizomicrobium sp.]
MEAPLKIFVLDATQTFGAGIARAGSFTLARHEERIFEDGECKGRPLETVAGCDVYVVQSLHAGPNASADDKLNRLLFFVGALKDAGAARVTAVTPYLCYARKDRRTKWQDPLTLRYVAALFEAVGTDAVVTMDVHNDAAFENSFRRRTVALTAVPLFVEYAKTLGEERLCVISPDAGGAKRAQLFREALESACGREVGRGYVEKRRSAGTVSGGLLVGDVTDSTVLIIDDLVATGGTLQRAARAARAGGARRVIALATHGLFMTGASEILADAAIDRIGITDIVPPFRLAASPVLQKIDVLDAAGLFAQAIQRLHQNLRLDDLLAY